MLKTKFPNLGVQKPRLGYQYHRQLYPTNNDKLLFTSLWTNGKLSNVFRLTRTLGTPTMEGSKIL